MRRSPMALLGAGALVLGAGACSDGDEPTTAQEVSTTTPVADQAGPAGARLLARGTDVELVGDGGFAEQTLDVDAWVEDGEVVGEFRVSHVVVDIECANTNGTDTVLLAGRVTVGDPNHLGGPGQMLGVAIRDGEPDGASLLGDDIGASSCAEFLAAMPDDLLTGDAEYIDVAPGSDIELG